MFADPSRDRARIASARRTLPAQSSVLAMGSNPRAVGVGSGCDVAGGSLPLDRTAEGFLPSKERVLSLLMQVLFFDQKDYRERVAKAFRDAVLNPPLPPIGGVDDDICGTPVSFFRAALDSVGYRICDFYRINKLSDMFHESHVKHLPGESVCEVFFMDVVLNRAIVPTTSEINKNGNDVRVMRCFKPDDLDDSVDYQFRALIAFIPNAGVFYCSCDRRRADAGVEKTLVPHDMSWLRLHRSEVLDSQQRCVPMYTIGDGGYVKRLHCGGGSDGLPVSVWRMTYNILCDKRVIIRANQCADQDGPMLPPDVISGQNFSLAWPREVLALEFNSILAGSKSARLGGRHYASGTRYFDLPSSCLVLDPVVDPMVDVVIDDAPCGTSVDRQTVVRVRHTLMLKTDPVPMDDLKLRIARRASLLLKITRCNTAIRRGMRTTSGVRNTGGDVGNMYAIGMRVEGDGATMIPYAANEKVDELVLRDMVAALCCLGRLCYPDLMHLIKTLESDSGVPMMSPMDGKDGDWVGRTIDMSVNLGNSSHFDVNDCSQGFAVWTEEMPGKASNWYFIMPNVFGTRADGKPFSGLAVRLYHGVAISWDGRVLRHCTSVSKPDGEDKAEVFSGGGQRFDNHLYGTFTACKEKVVRAGRVNACAAIVSSSTTCKDDTIGGVTTPFDDELNLGMELVGVGAPLQQRKKKKRRRKEY
jgi:hypothetical protein